MSQPLCIFGEVLFDCFPDGREVLGGAPFNVAWHLQAFGQSPLFISRIGEDEAGHRIDRAMADWGMRRDGLQRDPLHPTGRVTVTLEQGEPSYEIVANSAYDFIATSDLPGDGPAFIYHGSLGLRNPVSAAALAELKSGSDALVFVDVNLRTPWWEKGAVLHWLDHAHWVKLNRDELALLGDGGDDELAGAQAFVQEHRLLGLVLTLGADGALAIDAQGNSARVKPEPVARVVDAVGAGDAFASVLILGLRLGWPMAVTLQRAQDFASALVQQRGATISNPEVYGSFSARWGLDESPESTPRE